MSTKRLEAGLQQVRCVLASQCAEGLPDEELLARFCHSRDEAAFEVLVWRHGPMVLRHCRRLLRYAEDADDAFQATFFTLARKAGSIRKGARLSGWLFRVAYRIAVEARIRAARAGRFEQLGTVDVAGPTDDPAGREMYKALVEEIERLPDKYRLAVVLCYMQGRSVAEAGQQLGCPKGTIGTRLAWARRQLQDRLTRRGFTLGGGFLAAVLADKATAAVPATLARAAVGAALAGAAGTVSMSVSSLAEGVMKAMLWTKMKTVAALVLTLAAAGSGGLLIYRAAAGEQTDDQVKVVRQHDQIQRAQDKLKQAELQVRLAEVEQRLQLLDIDRMKLTHQRDELKAQLAKTGAPSASPAAEARPIQVPSPSSGILVRIGHDLKVGDRVKEGQVLAKVDDRLLLAELVQKRAKLAQSKAAAVSAEMTLKEAQIRYERRANIHKKAKGVISDEDVGMARITYQHMQAEYIKSQQDVKIAEAEIQEVELLLAMQTIHSPRDGVILSIERQTGEFVKQGDTVMTLARQTTTR